MHIHLSEIYYKSSWSDIKQLPNPRQCLLRYLGMSLNKDRWEVDEVEKVLPQKHE